MCGRAACAEVDADVGDSYEQHGSNGSSSRVRHGACGTAMLAGSTPAERTIALGQWQAVRFR